MASQPMCKSHVPVYIDPFSLATSHACGNVFLIDVRVTSALEHEACRHHRYFLDTCPYQHAQHMLFNVDISYE